MALVEALEEYLVKRARPAEFVMERYPNSSVLFWQRKACDVERNVAITREQLRSVKLQLAKLPVPSPLDDPHFVRGSNPQISCQGAVP